MGGSSGGGGGWGGGDSSLYQTTYNPQGQSQYWYNPGTPAPNSLAGQSSTLLNQTTPGYGDVNRNSTFWDGGQYVSGVYGTPGGTSLGYNNTPMPALANYNSPNQYAGAGLWANDLNSSLWTPQLSQAPGVGDPIWYNSISGGSSFAGQGNYQPTGGVAPQYMLDQVNARTAPAAMGTSGPGWANTGIQGSMSNYGDTSGASRWWGANGRAWGT